MEKKLVLESRINFIAEAALENPNLGWMEFILTDNQPNDNKQGIKSEAFAGLIQSGLFMPLKMALGEIQQDHSEARPLGTIASLEDQTEKIFGKAAIWKLFRANDYKMLLEMSSKKEPINISWELSYTESDIDEDGVEWLGDPVLTAAAIVGLPAYGNRTPVLSVASKKDEGETDMEEKKVPESEEPETEETKTEVVVNVSVDAEEVKSLRKQVEDLEEYKETRETEDAKASMLKQRIGMFAEAGFDFTDEEIETNELVWLELSDEAFQSMLKLMVNIKQTKAASTSVPDVSGTPESTSNIDIVREGFREMKQ